MTTLALLIMCEIRCMSQETLSSYLVILPISDQHGCKNSNFIFKFYHHFLLEKLKNHQVNQSAYWLLF